MAGPLRELQDRYSTVDLGSYPGKVADSFRLSLVARGTDEAELDQVAEQLRAIIRAQGGVELD